jgi:hypothetical protein
LACSSDDYDTIPRTKCPAHQWNKTEGKSNSDNRTTKLTNFVLPVRRVSFGGHAIFPMNVIAKISPLQPQKQKLPPPPKQKQLMSPL